jgi:hypothetical protein
LAETQHLRHNTLKNNTFLKLLKNWATALNARKYVLLAFDTQNKSQSYPQAQASAVIYKTHIRFSERLVDVSAH